MCVSCKAFVLEYQTLDQPVPIGHLNWTNSYITFIQDAQGAKYLVKQIKPQEKVERWAKIICEIVALEIGHSVSVAQNYACIIPAGVHFLGKDVRVPATLHTHVPGIRFDQYKYNEKFPSLAIKQRDQNGKAIGLTYSVIHDMCHHRDFPPMVALDTFVGNPARHKHNFFYDPETDNFYGIDMGASFYTDLCRLSLATIEELIVDDMFLLNQEEGVALKAYLSTIKLLLKLHKPTIICQQIDAYAVYAGLYNSDFFDVDTQRRCEAYLTDCKKKIYRSYMHAEKLVEAIELLIRKKNKN